MNVIQQELMKKIYGARQRTIRSICPLRTDMHLHEAYEIYLFFKGDVDYFVENKRYHLKQHDMFIFNNRELHAPSVLSDMIYDRYVIHFPAKLIQTLCTPECNLLSCFDNRAIGEGNLRKLSPVQFDNLVGLFDKIYDTLDDDSIYSNIMTLSAILEILVVVNNIYDNPVSYPQKDSLSPVISNIIEYINQNFENDLSLNTIAQQYFLDKSYLCRKFKTECGVTLHQYIVSKRLLYAKKLLANGVNVTEVCLSSGFNNYSNFMRAFKKHVGITPMMYMQGKLPPNDFGNSPQ